MSHVENAHINFVSAMRFADQLVRGGLALNGGALIALPPFAALFKVNPQVAFISLGCAAVAFVIGLFAAGLVSGFGYLGATAMMNSSLSRIDFDRYSKTSGDLHLMKEAQAVVDAEFKSSKKFELWAKIAGVVTLVSFAIGSVCSAWAITNHAG